MMTLRTSPQMVKRVLTVNHWHPSPALPNNIDSLYAPLRFIYTRCTHAIHFFWRAKIPFACFLSAKIPCVSVIENRAFKINIGTNTECSFAQYLYNVSWSPSKQTLGQILSIRSLSVCTLFIDAAPLRHQRLCSYLLHKNFHAKRTFPRPHSSPSSCDLHIFASGHSPSCCLYSQAVILSLILLPRHYHPFRVYHVRDTDFIILHTH